MYRCLGRAPRTMGFTIAKGPATFTFARPANITARYFWQNEPTEATIYDISITYRIFCRRNTFLTSPSFELPRRWLLIHPTDRRPALTARRRPARRPHSGDDGRDRAPPSSTTRAAA